MIIALTHDEILNVIYEYLDGKLLYNSEFDKDDIRFYGSDGIFVNNLQARVEVN